MSDDAALLRRYAEDRSEAAFAELVRRHLSLVYAVALRQCGGNAHLAQDVAQRVFTDLARKAAALASRPVLSGWLHRATQFAATDVVRAERRRRIREQEAHAMQELTRRPGAEPDWDRLRPVLDQAVNELGERDRDAVMLRFIEGRAFADIGAVLRLSEDAARMRVDRALDKLRGSLAKRGVTSTTAALAVVLANQAGVAAPAGLAATVTGAALAGATAARIAVFWGMTKLEIGIAGALVLAGIGGVVLQQQANSAGRKEIQALQNENRQIERLEDENRRMARDLAEVAVLREDDAELLRLRNEAAGLRQRLEAVAPIKPAAPQEVFVSGEVRAPGRYAIPPGASVSLQDLLTKAGGLTEISKGSAIRVVRRLPDGKVKVFLVDVEKESQGEGVGSAFGLESHDTVFVPQRLVPRQEAGSTPTPETGP
jgi:RNA polymerase sigma factor (sigma-70 family)